MAKITLNVYMTLVNDADHDPAEAVGQALVDWIGEGRKGITLVEKAEAQEPGLRITSRSKHDLKDPLNALYCIAKDNKCHFVVGFICPDSGEAEDVCYFGHEEGKPDLYEVASYLGL